MRDNSIVELLTVQDTARLLNVSPITIRRYIAEGRLAALRVGRGVRLRREAVDQFVTPLTPRATRPAAGTGKALTSEDSFWNIVGIGHSEGPTDVATNTHHYLAEAYAAKEGAAAER